MRGTLDANDKYVMKEEGRLDGPWTRGERPRPGARNDLYDVVDMIDAGKTSKKIAAAFPIQWVKFYRGIQSYRLTAQGQRYARPQIFILWGKSGTGKTRLCHETFPEAYWKPKSKWWCGYATQNVVVLDEFYSWLSFDTLLRMLDWYPLQVETKGGSTQLLANCFVFTSNVDPQEWYGTMHFARREAMFRRFKEFGSVHEFHDDGSVTLDKRFK